MADTTSKRRVGIYPGTFDPLTNGHVDIILRGARLFDRILVAILVNAGKQPMFDTAERVAMVREVFREYPNVEVDTFDGLLVDYARQKRATAIVRGIRAVSDFEYEFQMAGMNTRLNPRIETLFLMASERNQFIASRFVKEIARLGGDISSFVPAAVNRRVRRKFSEM